MRTSCERQSGACSMLDVPPVKKIKSSWTNTDTITGCKIVNDVIITVLSLLTMHLPAEKMTLGGWRKGL